MRRAGVRAGQIDHAELAERLPMLAQPDERAAFDEDGGVIRARATIEALIGALRERIVFDEVLSLRPTPAGTVEVRAGGTTAEHDRVVVCAGRGTAALARGAGLPLPMRQAAHVRLTFAVRGDAPHRRGVPARLHAVRSVRSAPTAIHYPATLPTPSGWMTRRYTTTEA